MGESYLGGGNWEERNSGVPHSTDIIERLQLARKDLNKTKQSWAVRYMGQERDFSVLKISEVEELWVMTQVLRSLQGRCSL